MAKIDVVFKVVVIESERGWGSSVIEVAYFDEERSALQFCKKINAPNNSPTVPDWYVYAQEPVMMMRDKMPLGAEVQ